MLEELGVAYEHAVVGPHSAEAREGSPFGKIPSLVDGEDFLMYESAAINTYLGDKFRGRDGKADLVPAAGTRERGRYEQLTMCI
jgi:glutathione S-transferase